MIVWPLNSPLKPLGYQQLTVSSTAVGLTLPTSSNAVRMAVIIVENNSIRYRDDGTDPTTSVGMPLIANQSIVIDGHAISAFRAIRQSSDAKLNISYYGDY